MPKILRAMQEGSERSRQDNRQTVWGLRSQLMTWQWILFSFNLYLSHRSELVLQKPATQKPQQVHTQTQKASRNICCL